MTKTIQEFAELNGYSVDKAEKIVTKWAENSENPALKQWARSLLDRQE